MCIYIYTYMVIDALGLQIACDRVYLCTSGPKVSIIYMLGALGLRIQCAIELGPNIVSSDDPNKVEIDFPNPLKCHLKSLRRVSEWRGSGF